MKYRLLRFRTRKADVAAVEKAIIAFVAKVADEPGTLRYESFREPDGITFVHVMSFADDKDEKAHRETAHFKEFEKVLERSCDSPPQSTTVRKVSGAGR
jgi:quinol monooxygenase YgiN